MEQVRSQREQPVGGYSGGGVAASLKRGRRVASVSSEWASLEGSAEGEAALKTAVCLSKAHLGL